MIRSLQIGRGFAALAVAAYHLSIMFGDPRFGFSPVLSNFTDHGYLGVDFFFVLSGFIILSAHTRDIGVPAQAGQFFLKRFIRVYPLYWIFTAVVLIGSAATGGVNGVPTHFADLASVVTLIHWVPYDPPLNPSWTLYYEIMFYVLFSILILNRRIGWIVLAAWFLTAAVLWEYPAHGDWSFSSAFFSVFNLSFLAGICAFWLSNNSSQRVAGALISMGIAIFAGTYYFDMDILPFEDIRPLYSVAFMLLLGGLAALERLGWRPSGSWLLMLGDASYTLYLSHESVGSTALKIVKKLRVADFIDQRIIYFAILSAMIVFALVFYRLVEKPLLDQMRKVLRRRKLVTPQDLAAA
ncbi:acyltransferase family protein [Sphingobium yanoikuyae]|uniref:acyltransferase family protein n=1 Tax=Sphingobium yanoikuyae TaxID=13690 RepID=UPI000A779CB4|nr:acyltransferase [Sphingobium yanoikuyae]